MADKPDSFEEFDWIQLRKDMDAIGKVETVWDKFKRKGQEHPLVPVGCFATVCALTAGLYAMKTGNKALSQKMMRARIIAQGSTIAILLIGVIYSASGSTSK